MGLRTLAACAAAVWFVSLGAGSAGADEPRGAWNFTDASLPVKVVVLGGSVSAYGLGGYAQWLPAACKRVEVKNVAKAKLGAAALRERFDAQVVRNRKLDVKAHETWLVFLGGLNSIGTPEVTNVDIAKTFRAAHEHGMKTMGLTVNPWGSEDDHRWQGAAGLAYLSHTQKAVDFMLGRLSPAEAFGKSAEGRTTYLPGELPDVAVDLWDSPLRHKEAALRPEKATLHSVKTTAATRARLKGLEGSAKERALAALVQATREIPRWFMRPELIGFDAVHPNSQGHKVIARAICQKAPPSWGCDCAALDGLAWDKRARKAVPL